MICISNSTNHHVGPAGSTFVPDEFLGVVGHALALLRSSMAAYAPCNAAFKALPGGRDFNTLLDDSRIWINYDARNNGHLWGYTRPTINPNDLVISQYALRMGLWSTAATIVHELAHLNGAPGVPSNAAERTVQACRMGGAAGPFDPNVVGQFIQRQDFAIV